MSPSPIIRTTRDPFAQTKSTLARLTATAALAAMLAGVSGAPAIANPRPVATHTVAVAPASVQPAQHVLPDTLGKLHTITTIGSSADPINLDQNPYGLAIAPYTSGALTKGDLVICNFNNGVANLNIQSLGSTVEVLHPYKGAKPKRLSIDPRLTGCGALTFDAFGGIEVMSYTANDIAVLDSSGTVRSALTDASLAGPWGGIYGARPGTLGNLYVSNAYSGNIVRVDPGPLKYNTIISGITPNHGVPGAILAPAGLTYDPSSDRLYIVDGNANRVLFLANASRIPANGIQVTPQGTFSGPYANQLHVYFSGSPLNAPISSVLLFNDHLVVGNTGDNLLVDIGPGGRLSNTKLVDTGAVGAIFGLAASGNSYATLKIFFNDDNDNTLKAVSQ